MTFSTKTNRMFFKDRSIDILVYIGRHPYCLKSDIYHDVTKNAFTKELIDELQRRDLLVIEKEGRSYRLHLTSKGEDVVELVDRIEHMIPGD